MWHRFGQPMRRVILAALSNASNNNRASAEPGDFLDAILCASESSGGQILPQFSLNATEGDPAKPNPPVNAISADALRLFEQAYEEAALLSDRAIGTDHLLLSMLKLDLAPALREKGLSYDAIRLHVQRNRECGIGPDASSVAAKGIAARSRRRLALTIHSVKKTILLRRSVAHPRFSIDPYPLYRKMRSTGSVRRDVLIPSWVVTGHAEASQVLRDRRFSSAPRSVRAASGTKELDQLPAGPVRRDLGVIAGVLTRQIVFTDPPDHWRIRGRMGELFPAQAIEAMRQRVRQIAVELIDRVLSAGRMDLIQDFAYPLPLRVVTGLLGFPPDDEPVLKRWSDVFAMMLAFDPTLRGDLEARQCTLETRRYFDGFMESMRGRPEQSPLMKMLAPAEGGALNVDELFANCGFTLAAGHETTTSVLGNGIRALLSHPDQLRRLRNDPSMMPAAVEELLRYESPVQWTSRRAMEEAVIGGQHIAKGDSLLISLGAANRDPRIFTDPDRLDLTRANAAKHLAFSGGGHYCIGATLGRIELQIGLAALLERLPNLRLDPAGVIQWKTGTALRKLESLPVLFDP